MSSKNHTGGLDGSEDHSGGKIFPLATRRCPFEVLKSQSTRGSKIFGNGQKQPYLKLCLLKASHEQVIKSTLFCLLILMWSRDRQFKFDPPGSNFGSKNFLKFTNFAFSCQNKRQPIKNQMMFLY